MLPSTATKHLVDYFSSSTIFFYFITDNKGACRYSNSFFNNLFNKEAISPVIDNFFFHPEKYYQLIQQCVLGKEKPVMATLDMKMPGGSMSIVSWEFSVCTVDNELSIQAIGSILDEADRRSSLTGIMPERYTAYEKSLEGLWRFDTEQPVPVSLSPDEIIQYWRKHAALAECNDSMARMYGFEKAEEIVGTTLEQLMDYSDEVRLENMRKFIRNGFRSMQVETKEFDRYGNPKYFLNNMEGTVKDGMVIRVWGTQLDITEQRLAEEKNRRQATVLNNVTDVIITLDINKNVTSWNKIVERLSGITEQEALGQALHVVLATDYHPYSYEQVGAIVLEEGIWHGEVSFTGHDGETKYLLHTISVLHNEKGENIGMLGVGKDITERKKIEARLQQSETFFRTLAAKSLDGILMTDENGRINYCGPSIIKISGHDLTHLLGHTIFEFIHPEDVKIAAEAFTEELNGQTSVTYIVIRIRHATRGWIWSTVRGHNLLADPVLKAMVVYFTDDTNRKQIEDRLRESESRFRNMIHNLKLGIILLNGKSEMLVWNQAALDMLGLTEEQLMSLQPYDPRWNVIHENGTNFPQHTHPIATATQTKRAVLDVVMGVYSPFKNERVWLLVNAEPLLDAEKNIINVICSFADITEQRRLAQQLIDQEVQKQRLITQATIDGQEKERQEIGKELHDNINQHLTTTRLYLEVAGEKASGEVLEMIRLAHKTLTDIVNEIRKLSQSLVPPTLGDLGLTESIKDLCDSLRRTHSYRIDFHHRYFNEEELPVNLKLMIFRIIQEQVSNIIHHAHAKSIWIKLQADAENIIFSIADDGQGFDPEHYKKGLGINNITNRASLFSGKAEIDAAPGKGCTITITIPLSEAVGTLN